jgi:RNA polymerase sigma factor (sigma-70 family)
MTLVKQRISKELVESTTSHSDAERANDNSVDAELVIRVLQNEQSAFTQLVERHHQHVGGLARRLLGREDVDDIVQEIYVALLGKLKQFKQQSKFQTWLTSVVLNCCRTELRWTKRWRHWLLAKYPEHKKSEPEATDEQAAQQDKQNQQLHAALGQLSHGDREVLALRYFENQSLAEIAELLKSNTTAIEKRMSRARARLKKILEAANTNHENTKE